MKVSIFLVCLISAATCSVTNPVPREPMIDLNAISRMTAQELDQLAGGLAAEELIRTKRSGLGLGFGSGSGSGSILSGSGSILGQVSKSITSGLGSKLALVGQASAGASALFGGGSSKGNSDHGYGYGPPAMQTYKTQSFDFFSLKKSILNTLFQAVKAITGGVTILKGQLIKGGGALVSGVGRIVSVKGDAVTNLGRHIVNSASLVPPKKSAPVVHHAPVPVHHAIPSGPPHPVSSYGPPTSSAHFSAPSGPADHYGPPTVSVGHYDAPSPTNFYGPPGTHNSIYGVPSKYSHPFEGRGKGLQAGFILLQPLEGTNGPAPHDTHTAPTGPPASFVSGAIQAIKGFIGGNSYKSPSPAPQPTAISAPESHHEIASVTAPESPPPSAPTAPSDNYPNSIYHPPPQLPIEHSYNSYSSQESIPPFKPLDNSGEIEKPSTSYGQPITSEEKLPGPINLDTMVDSLIESHPYDSYGQPYVGPSYDSYLASFPNAQSPHSSKEPNSANYARHLSPLQLNKIISNVDKINVHRSDDQVATFNPYDLYTEMAIMQMAIQNINSTLNEASKSRTEDRSEPQQSEESPQEDFESTRTHAKQRVDVDRSIAYELRGNKIVRLTDSMTDEH